MQCFNLGAAHAPRLMRLGKEFEKRIQEGQGTGKVTDSMRKDHEKKWKEKVTHGYLQSQIEKDDTIDQNATNNWPNSDSQRM